MPSASRRPKTVSAWPLVFGLGPRRGSREALQGHDYRLEHRISWFGLVLEAHQDEGDMEEPFGQLLNRYRKSYST